jgi:hypothetical protein
MLCAVWFLTLRLSADSFSFWEQVLWRMKLILKNLLVILKCRCLQPLGNRPEGHHQRPLLGRGESGFGLREGSLGPDQNMYFAACVFCVAFFLATFSRPLRLKSKSRPKQ